MSEKTLKADVEAFLPEDAYSDDLIKFLLNGGENGSFAKLFTKEQRIVLIAIFQRIVQSQDFHQYKDQNPHNETLGKAYSNLDAKLRNHRHNLNKTFSSKPEF